MRSRGLTAPSVIMDDQGGMMGGPPVPPPPPPGSGTNRFLYLTTRLRNRQITMEEATELFAIQQTMIRSSAAPPPMAPTPSTSVAPPAAGTGGTMVLSEDLVPYALIGMGVSAGLLAAMIKRFSEGPRSPTPTPPSRTGSSPP
jgi:hypothetical protein